MTTSDPYGELKAAIGIATGRSCDGNCEDHRGMVRRVHVAAKDGYDWGFFYYCDEAVDTDTRNGMKVDDSPSPPR